MSEPADLGVHPFFSASALNSSIHVGLEALLLRSRDSLHDVAVSKLLRRAVLPCEYALSKRGGSDDGNAQLTSGVD